MRFLPQNTEDAAAEIQRRDSKPAHPRAAAPVPGKARARSRRVAVRPPEVSAARRCRYLAKAEIGQEKRGRFLIRAEREIKRLPPPITPEPAAQDVSQHAAVLREEQILENDRRPVFDNPAAHVRQPAVAGKGQAPFGRLHQSRETVSRLDLPTPDGPTTATTLPRGTSQSIREKASGSLRCRPRPSNRKMRRFWRRLGRAAFLTIDHFASLRKSSAPRIDRKCSSGSTSTSFEVKTLSRNSVFPPSFKVSSAFRSSLAIGLRNGRAHRDDMRRHRTLLRHFFSTSRVARA